MCLEMNKMVKFYDVSLPIKEGMIVYPGNPEPMIRRYSSIPQNKVNESLITLGSHTGTHVDSKLHIQKDAMEWRSYPWKVFTENAKCWTLPT